MTFDISRWERTIEEQNQKMETERCLAFKKYSRALKDFFRHKRVKRAYLVGSILREGRFYPFSDIDIAVEGLEEDSLQLGCALEHLLERDVDLIELERCPFRDSIEKRGLRIL